jgi:hypothetical protein
MIGFSHVPRGGKDLNNPGRRTTTNGFDSSVEGPEVALCCHVIENRITYC